LQKALADHPEEVRVKSGEGAQVTVLELQVHSEDLGKVIGRQGRTAKANSNGAWRGGDQGAQTVYTRKSSKIDGIGVSPTIEFRNSTMGPDGAHSSRARQTRAKLPRNCSPIFRNGSQIERSFVGQAGGKTEPRLVALKSCWLSQNHRGQIVFHFEGVNSISDAEKFRGLEVLLPFEQR